MAATTHWWCLGLVRRRVILQRMLLGTFIGPKTKVLRRIPRVFYWSSIGWASKITVISTGEPVFSGKQYLYGGVLLIHPMGRTVCPITPVSISIRYLSLEGVSVEIAEQH